MIRNFGLMAILLLTFSASVSLVAAQDISSRENNAATQNDTSTASSEVQGIWKASLGEKEIIIAVNQSAQSLFGLAKFEGDNPWNGAVAGSISENAVSFSLAAFESDCAGIYLHKRHLGRRNHEGIFHPVGQRWKSKQGRFYRQHDQPGYLRLHPSRSNNRP